MAYRDDRQALALQIAELERENSKLRDELESAGKRYKRVQDEHHEARRMGDKRCILCGGSLLPVAVFAGHDIGSPIPLSMSTLRFGRADGGFTHSAPIHSLACSSCGYIHSFIPISEPGAGDGSDSGDGEDPSDGP